MLMSVKVNGFHVGLLVKLCIMLRRCEMHLMSVCFNPTVFFMYIVSTSTLSLHVKMDADFTSEPYSSLNLISTLS